MICSIKLMLIYNNIVVHVHIDPYTVYLCFVKNCVFYISKFNFIMSTKVCKVMIVNFF
jgi:hypothetical protein